MGLASPSFLRAAGAWRILGLLVIMVLGALLWKLGTRRPEIVLEGIEEVIDGALVTYRRAPAGPMSLQVEEEGEARILLDSPAKASLHVFQVVPRSRVTRVTYTPSAGGARGAGQLLSLPGEVRLGPRSLSWKPDGLEVTFRTVHAVRCRLRPSGAAARREPPWEVGPTTDHALLLTRDQFPFTSRFVIEIESGEGGPRSVDVALDEGARPVFLRGLIPWIEAWEHKRIGMPLFSREDLERSIEPGAYQEAMKILDESATRRLPSWFLEEIGGDRGILGSSAGLGLGDRYRFYQVLSFMEKENLARQLMRLPRTTEFASLYTRDFGPSDTPHYPGARTVWIPTHQLPPVEPVVLELEPPPAFAGSATGTNLEARLDLKGQRPQKAEIAVDTDLREYARLEIRINDRYVLRLLRPPDTRVRPEESGMLYLAFPAEMLEPGENRILISPPPVKGMLRWMFSAKGVQINPPGFMLHVVP